MGYKAKYQNKDGSVNWDLALPDAQFYTPETDNEYESFLKIEDGVVYFNNPNTGLDQWWRDVITRPNELTENISGVVVRKEAV